MKLLRFVIILFLCVIILQGAFFLFFSGRQREPIQADLIMVFSGTSARTEAGFRLAREGYGRNLAVSGYNLDQLRTVAEKHEHPAELGLLAQGKSRSTFEDAYNTRQIVGQNHLDSVLLLTSDYHLPRAYLLTRLMLLGTGVSVHPSAISASPLRGKLLAQEMVKFWGGLGEMAGYLLTGRLLLDVPLLQRTSTFLKKKAL
jgi:uncharacterized SAM-binding protein YcdF (DUF218 family)